MNQLEPGTTVSRIGIPIVLIAVTYLAYGRFMEDGKRKGLQTPKEVFMQKIDVHERKPTFLGVKLSLVHIVIAIIAFTLFLLLLLGLGVDMSELLKPVVGEV